MSINFNETLDWVEEMHSNKETSSTNLLGEMYVSIQNLMRNSKFSLLDVIFMEANVSKMSPEAMIALLRYSYACKQEYKEWHPLLQRIAHELETRKLDSKKILIGLI